MLGWLNRRRLKEQRILLYQNAMAAEASLKGAYFNNAAVLDQLSRLAEENRQIGNEQNDGSLLPVSKTARLLEINKECRRLYDMTASHYLESFDQAHVPVLGWDAYLSDRDRYE